MVDLPVGIGRESRSPDLFQGDDGDHLVNSVLIQRGKRQSDVRPVHATGVPFTGTFRPSGNLERYCGAEELTDGGTDFAVVGRFSNLSRMDWEPKPDVRGLAVRILGKDDADKVAGRELNLVTMTPPIFVVRRRADFHSLARGGTATALQMLVFRRITAKALWTKAKFEGNLGPFSHKLRELQQETYHSVNTYFLTKEGTPPRAVRFRWAPMDTAVTTPKQPLDALFYSKEHTFRLEFDLLENDLGQAEQNRVREDAMREWKKGVIEQTVDAGLLTIPKQDGGPPQKLVDRVEGYVFDPTELVDGITHSEDDILLARRAAYKASHQRRRTQP